MSVDKVRTSVQNPLLPGEWEALLLQVPTQVHRIVVRLALFHGYLKPTAPDECPVCGGKPATALDAAQ